MYLFGGPYNKGSSQVLVPDSLFHTLQPRHSSIAVCNSAPSGSEGSRYLSGNTRNNRTNKMIRTRKIMTIVVTMIMVVVCSKNDKNNSNSCTCYATRGALRTPTQTTSHSPIGSSVLLRGEGFLAKWEGGGVGEV